MIFLFLQCVSTVIIVYIIISPLNSYLYIHWILDLKLILLLLLLASHVPAHQSGTWHDIKCEIMETILDAKAQSCAEFKQSLVND